MPNRSSSPFNEGIYNEAVEQAFNRTGRRLNYSKLSEIKE